MKRMQLDALSQNLSRAISPSTRKQNATTRILEQFEPLPILRPPHAPATPSTRTKPDIEDTGVNSTPVSVDTISKLVPVSKTQGSTEPRRSGYLKVPNEILDQILPSLDPSEAVVFLRLYRLSVGFNQPTCTVGLTGLTRACNISESTCRRALRRLIELGFIRQLEVVNTKEVKGTTYQIETGVNLKPVSNPNRSQPDTGVTVTPNTVDESDDSKNDSHHHRPASADDDSAHLKEIKNTYSELTGNPWLHSDTEAYTQNPIATVPITRAIEIMQGVKQRCGGRIHSFNYFVREIVKGSDPRNRQFQKRALAKIVKRVRDLHIGAHNYGIADFVFDVKEACVREGVIFDHELFNSLNS
jgi:DNA-binding Lrp family transcriptional regulator